MKRRTFLKQTAKSGAFLSLPISLSSFDLTQTKNINIGIVADIHQDVIHDGEARLRFFMDDMKSRNPNFIIQMGDFALPHSYNQPFLDIWNEFEGPKYHILGNHDMRDHGYTKEQTMSWWKMKKRYYSFDLEGFHFIILDGNDNNPKPWSGYDRFIGQEQKEWLQSDLDSTLRPTIVFIHQSLESEEGVVNREEIRAILEEAKISSNQSKVVACFSGHHHTDYSKLPRCKHTRH